MKTLCVFAIAAAALPACNPYATDFAFYEVTRVRSEECAIRANGEFCAEPEQFDPPVVEVWTVSQASDTPTLYVDEEVWVLAPLSDDEDPATASRTASRRSVVTDGNSGCTTTRLRDLDFVTGDSGLSGTMRESSVLEGPPSCGDTPAGQRTVDTLSGTAGGP